MKFIKVVRNRQEGGEWQPVGSGLPAGRVKDCQAACQRFAGEGGQAALSALPALVESILSRTLKEKPAYERFLRANPQAVLAREQPPLDLAADAPQILANLPPAAAEAWRDLMRFLAGFGGYSPSVEFRSIHHGMWAVNYESRGGKNDLCGLIVQNGEMTVRTILFGATHFQVKDMLDEFGDPVRAAFHQAHYYDEFEHQWLFIPCSGVADLPGIKKLLALQAEALPKRQ